MLKRKVAIILAIACLMSSSTVALGSTSTSRVGTDQLSSGIVAIQNPSATNVKEKIKISKGDQHYFYDFKSNNRFPLQLGDGKYTISIMENVTANKYKMIETKEVTLKSSSEKAVFLQPIQMIYWNEDMKAIVKAKELTKGLKDDKEKMTAIYNYIVNNISYDYEKAKNVSDEYIPSTEDTLKTLQGICYDYSSLFAAMLRSEGIPTKLVMGHKNDIEQYHAWNEVFLKDTNEWVTIDTTYDSAFTKVSIKPVMMKDKRDYTIDKQY